MYYTTIRDVSQDLFFFRNFLQYGKKDTRQSNNIITTITPNTSAGENTFGSKTLMLEGAGAVEFKSA